MQKKGMYRGRRTDNREWTYGGYVIFSFNSRERQVITRHVIVDESGCPQEVDPDTVGSLVFADPIYNSLMYEGDIYRDSSGEIFIVKWADLSCSFRAYYEDGYPEITVREIIRSGMIEKIGTIHDEEIIKR